jgi:hypothetical protein
MDFDCTSEGQIVIRHEINRIAYIPSQKIECISILSYLIHRRLNI